MSRTVTKQSIWNLLQNVSKKGEAVEIIAPESGGDCPHRDYYNLKVGILRKTPEYWKRGRAGFAYTSWPKPGDEVAGIWVFPDLGSAQTKRLQMLTEGWTVRIISWADEDLPGNG